MNETINKTDHAGETGQIGKRKPLAVFLQASSQSTHPENTPCVAGALTNAQTVISAMTPATVLEGGGALDVVISPFPPSNNDKVERIRATSVQTLDFKTQTSPHTFSVITLATPSIHFVPNKNLDSEICKSALNEHQGNAWKVLEQLNVLSDITVADSHNAWTQVLDFEVRQHLPNIQDSEEGDEYFDLCRIICCHRD